MVGVKSKITLVEYDDNNIAHLLYAPDYGQVGGKLKWSVDNYSPFKIFFHNKYKKQYIIYYSTPNLQSTDSCQ